MFNCLLAPLAVLLGQVLARDELQIVPVTTTIGVLAAAVQFLGLARWPFLVPALARAYLNPDSSPATREATAVVFDALHRYLGVAVGECLGYLFTGTWTTLVGVAMLQSSTFDAWLAWPGIAIGLLLAVGSLEFVGSFEEDLVGGASASPPNRGAQPSLRVEVKDLVAPRPPGARSGPAQPRMGTARRR
jgi:hypothetical protein